MRNRCTNRLVPRPFKLTVTSPSKLQAFLAAVDPRLVSALRVDLHGVAIDAAHEATGQ